MISLEQAVKIVEGTPAKFKSYAIRETNRKWLFSLTTLSGNPVYLGGWVTIDKITGEESFAGIDSKEEAESVLVKGPSKELVDIIRDSLVAFALEALEGPWTGRREREAISLYAFGFLLKQVKSDGVLNDPAQIGIEFPVPQVVSTVEMNGIGRRREKLQVCKDLVIWPRPAMTCWDQAGQPNVSPIAILEWKFGVETTSRHDLEWLKAFSRNRPEFTGFAISANRPGSSFLMKVAEVTGGKAYLDWLCM